MEKSVKSQVIATSLAIFAMLFGSGNLIFPLALGVHSGNCVNIALIGFIISGILIPISGLFSMIYFNGDYKEFFYRIGKVPGEIMMFICMLFIGPLLIMPRITSLTYQLISPFAYNNISIFSFSLIFSFITFISCYHKENILGLLGKILSPIKIISISTIIFLGFLNKENSFKIICNENRFKIFIDNLLVGYKTLDLLATIFFGYMVISLLNKDIKNEKNISKLMFYSSFIGGLILTFIYVGLAYIGSFNSNLLLVNLNEGDIFVKVLMNILGNKGIVLISITILIACLSTMITLSSVFSEYVKNNVININYSYILFITLVISTIISQFKLDNIFKYSEPIIYIIYPALIVLNFCNILYKLYNFKFVKLPFFITLFISSYIYLPEFIDILKH